jgi:hypothetical protein
MSALDGGSKCIRVVRGDFSQVGAASAGLETAGIKWVAVRKVMGESRN